MPGDHATLTMERTSPADMQERKHVAMLAMFFGIGPMHTELERLEDR